MLVRSYPGLAGTPKKKKEICFHRISFGLIESYLCLTKCKNRFPWNSWQCWNENVSTITARQPEGGPQWNHPSMFISQLDVPFVNDDENITADKRLKLLWKYFQMNDCCARDSKCGTTPNERGILGKRIVAAILKVFRKQ